MAIPPGSLYFSLDAADPASYPGSGSTWTDTESSIAVTLSGTSFVSDFGGAITFPNSATGSFPVNASFPLGADPVTINMWIKFNALPVGLQDPLFVIGNPAYNGCHFLFLLPNGAFGFNGNITYDMAGPLRANYGPLYSVDNKYHQLTTTYDGAEMKTYWDGQLIPNSNFSNVGGLTAYSTGYIGFFNGSTNHASYAISQLQLFDQGFTALEVEELYDAQFYRYANIVASYDLNDLTSYPGTGSTVYDLTGNGKNLTLSNTTYYDGVNYNSLIFNAASPSYANYNGNIGVPTGPPVFTFFMWIKTTSFTANDSVVFSYGRENPSIGGIPFIMNRYFSNVAYTEFGSGQADIAPGTPTVLNEWTNYCITSDGTTYKFYIDGALVGSTALSGADIWTLPQLTIGDFDAVGAGLPSNIEFNLLDVYDIALSAGEITTLYNETVTRFVIPTPYSGSVGGRQFAQGFNSA